MVPGQRQLEDLRRQARRQAGHQKGSNSDGQNRAPHAELNVNVMVKV
jgi:hypothetical protein